MSDNWQKAYSELKEYTAKNPQIEIGMNVIAIPGDVRPEFYRLFDTARVAFLKEKCQTLLDEAVLLSSNYAQAAQEVTKSLGLSEIEVPASLNWFLNDPVNGLIRSLFDPLFDLLKGKIEIDAFEQEASRNIESSFSQLFRLGYEKWVVLSLVNLLAPDRALVVPIEDIQAKCHQLEADEKTGLSEETIPDPEEMKLLSLGYDGREPAFIISDLIVRSAKLNRYVSIGADLADAMWTAKQVSGKREWYHLRKLGRLYTPIHDWPDLVIYTDDQPEDIALVADFSRFCRPDIIVECMEEADWYQRGGLKRVKQNHDFIKPRLGSYVVSRLPVPEEAFRELMPQPAASEPSAKCIDLGEPSAEQVSQEPVSESIFQETPSVQIPLSNAMRKQLDIHIITAGYEASKLNPIIEALFQANSR